MFTLGRCCVGLACFSILGRLIAWWLVESLFGGLDSVVKLIVVASVGGCGLVCLGLSGADGESGGGKSSRELESGLVVVNW